MTKQLETAIKNKTSQAGEKYIFEAERAYLTIDNIIPSRFSVFDKIGADRGVVFASGEAFKVKRRLTMQILRALGVGKSAFSTGIEDEANNLLVHLDEFIGKDIYIQVSCLQFSDFE